MILCKKVVILYMQNVFFSIEGLYSVGSVTSLQLGGQIGLIRNFGCFPQKWFETERFSFNEPLLRLGVT